MLQIVLRPLAKQDLREITQYLAEQDQSLSVRFIEAVERSFTLLAQMPEAGSPHRSEMVQNVRRWILQDFPYLFFYRYSSEDLEVVRVLHQARDVEELL